MGGLGSGLYSSWSKPEPRQLAESCLTLDINVWNRRGYCQVGANEATDGITIKKIAWTNCNYGNARPWFICPKCGARVGKLFKPAIYSLIDNTKYKQQANAEYKIGGSNLYQCRKCWNLTYQSSNASGNLIRERRELDRRFSKKLKAPTKWNHFFHEIPPKPKGMHWKTYHRLVHEFLDAEKKYHSQVMEELNNLVECFNKCDEAGKQPSFTGILAGLRTVMNLAR